MKKLIICLMASSILTGCANSDSKGNKDDTTIVEDSSEIVEELSAIEIEDSVYNSIMREKPHLKFKNVPIDGSLDRFVSRMERSGFKTEEKTSGQAVLIGDFAGYKGCLVYVETLNGEDLVSKIAVRFPSQSQWKNLYGDYKHLKELLTAKYGKPASCVEKFQDSYGYKPENDHDRMYYVMSGHCNYETCFATDDGEITLWIEHNISSFAALMYKDKINSGIVQNHAIDDL